MIIQFILWLTTMIIQGIILIGHEALPEINLATQLFSFLTTILSVTQQALNFMYLIFGDTLFVVLPLITTLLTFKYIAYPIIQIIRSIFINSNE